MPIILRLFASIEQNKNAVKINLLKENLNITKISTFISLAEQFDLNMVDMSSINIPLSRN